MDQNGPWHEANACVTGSLPYGDRHQVQPHQELPSIRTMESERHNNSEPESCFANSYRASAYQACTDVCQHSSEMHTGVSCGLQPVVVRS